MVMDPEHDSEPFYRIRILKFHPLDPGPNLTQDPNMDPHIRFFFYKKIDGLGSKFSISKTLLTRL